MREPSPTVKRLQVLVTPPRHGAVIVLAGTPINAGKRDLAPADVVIAVEAGMDHAQALGLRVDLFVGSFEAMSDEALQQAAIGGTRVVRFRSEAGRTDFEFALQKASDLQVDAVTVLRGRGGRIDYALTDLSVLAGPQFGGMQRKMFLDTSVVTIVDEDDVEIHGRPGEVVSLIAVGGPVAAITTMGLAHPMTSASLSPFGSHGLNNEMVTDSAVISVRGGVLAVVQTGFIRGAGDIDTLAEPHA